MHMDTGTALLNIKDQMRYTISPIASPITQTYRKLTEHDCEMALASCALLFVEEGFLAFCFLISGVAPHLKRTPPAPRSPRHTCSHAYRRRL